MYSRERWNNAYAPKKYQQAAMNSLFYRAKRICSNDFLFKKSYDFIVNLFLKNGYNINFILEVKRKIETKNISHSFDNST